MDEKKNLAETNHPKKKSHSLKSQMVGPYRAQYIACQFDKFTAFPLTLKIFVHYCSVQEGFPFLFPWFRVIKHCFLLLFYTNAINFTTYTLADFVDFVHLYHGYKVIS